MKRIITFALCLIFVLGFSLTASAENTEISYGAEYSLITAASEAYPDDGEKLTDGIYGTRRDLTDGYYASGAYVGFNKAQINENGNFSVILDLGKNYDNISEFTIGYLNETAFGIYAPKAVSFAVSDQRNGSYTELGKLDTVPENQETAATYAKSLQNLNASGQYVLVTITPDSATGKDDTLSVAPWTFIDEISVHINTTADSSTSTGDEVVPEQPTDDEVPEDDPSEDPPADTPQTGDDGLTVFAFVLLALASITMMLALFTEKRNNEF